LLEIRNCIMPHFFTAASVQSTKRLFQVMCIYKLAASMLSVVLLQQGKLFLNSEWFQEVEH